MENESKDEDDSCASSDHNNENNNEEESTQHEDHGYDNNEQDDNSNFVDEDDHIVHQCFNCHRQQSTFLQQFGQSYQTEYFDLKSTDVKTY